MLCWVCASHLPRAHYFFYRLHILYIIYIIGKGAMREPIAGLMLRHCVITAAASITNRRHYSGAIGTTAVLQLPVAAPYSNVSWDASWSWHEMVFGSSV